MSEIIKESESTKVTHNIILELGRAIHKAFINEIKNHVFIKYPGVDMTTDSSSSLLVVTYRIKLFGPKKDVRNIINYINEFVRIINE